VFVAKCGKMWQNFVAKCGKILWQNGDFIEKAIFPSIKTPLGRAK
jgi:hypothetical protein